MKYLNIYCASLFLMLGAAGAHADQCKATTQLTIENSTDANLKLFVPALTREYLKPFSLTKLNKHSTITLTLGDNVKRNTLIALDMMNETDLSAQAPHMVRIKAELHPQGCGYSDKGSYAMDFSLSNIQNGYTAQYVLGKK